MTLSNVEIKKMQAFGEFLAISGCDAYFNSELRRKLLSTDTVARRMSFSSDFVFPSAVLIIVVNVIIIIIIIIVTSHSRNVNPSSAFALTHTRSFIYS